MIRFIYKQPQNKSDSRGYTIYAKKHSNTILERFVEVYEQA